ARALRRRRTHLLSPGDRARRAGQRAGAAPSALGRPAALPRLATGGRAGARARGPGSCLALPRRPPARSGPRLERRLAARGRPAGRAGARGHRGRRRAAASARIPALGLAAIRPAPVRRPHFVGRRVMRNTRGLALVAVLWLVAALSIVVAGLLQSVRTE